MIINNLTITAIIGLWVILCLISQIAFIFILVGIIIVLLLYLIIHYIIINPIKTIKQRKQNKNEVRNIHKQREIIIQDTSKIIKDKNNTEEYYVSKVDPKYVYYHNTNNDSITVLDRNNGNLWMIQPSNKRENFYKYKLKYQELNKTIEIIENTLKKNKDYFENEGMKLIENYYHENNKLPGDFT